MKRRAGLTVSLAAGLAIATAIAPSRASIDPLIFEDVKPLSTETLSAMRGGLRINGLDLRIGFDLKTIIDGMVSVRTEFTVNDASGFGHLSSRVFHTSSHQTRQAVQPVASVDLASTTMITIGDQPPTVAPIESVQVPVGTPVVVQTTVDDPVLTEVVHELFPGIVARTTNKASGRTIAQTANVNIEVQNFAELHHSATVQAGTARIARQIDQAIIGSLSR
jgi:hypothetical protein